MAATEQNGMPWLETFLKEQEERRRQEQKTMQDLIAAISTSLQNNSASNSQSSNLNNETQISKVRIPTVARPSLLDTDITKASSEHGELRGTIM